MFNYIRAVQPGIPPQGWKDITPYFGRIPGSLGKWRILARDRGYLLAIQTVVENGQKYRRVATALAPHSPTNNRKQRKTK